jgi:hypothetical protein
MDVLKALADANPLAVFAGAVAAFAIGALWYSPALFAKQWMQELGIKAKDSKAMKDDGNLPQIMAMAFASTVVLSLAIALLFNLSRASGLFDGLALGLLVGLGVTAPTHGIHYLYEKRSLKLYVINAGYNLAMCLAIGLVLGVWPQ